MAQTLCLVKILLFLIPNISGFQLLFPLPSVCTLLRFQSQYLQRWYRYKHLVKGQQGENWLQFCCGIVVQLPSPICICVIWPRSARLSLMRIRNLQARVSFSKLLLKFGTECNRSCKGTWMTLTVRVSTPIITNCQMRLRITK